MRTRLFVGFGTILVLACLTVAQVDNPKRRIGPGLAGQVRSVRIERASFSKKANDYLEGSRVLAETIILDPQWRRLERRYYDRHGSILRVNVVTFDADGYQAEVSEYDGEDGLISKIVYIYDDRRRLNEHLTYKPDGTLQFRTVTTRRVPGKVAEVSTYNGDGSFRNRAVNTFAQQGDRIESSVYNEDGSLAEKRVIVGDGEGRSERFEYKPDGSLLARFVDLLDSEGFLVEAAEYNEDGSIRRKESFTREFDAQGNWIKETKSEWDAKAGTLVPTASSYQVIVYY